MCNVCISRYLSPDYLPSRPLSTISPSGASPWSKGGPMRMAMSETESMESLSSIQAQIAQARNLSLQSRNILASIPPQGNGIHRSDSFKSTKSEQVCICQLPTLYSVVLLLNAFLLFLIFVEVSCSRE